MRKVYLTFVALFFAMLGFAQGILGVEFGSDTDVVLAAMVDRFGKANVETPDGEHIVVKNIDYDIDDVKINFINFAFSYINGEHKLKSIALATKPMVLSYESDEEKIKEFNGYAVSQCNTIATKLHDKYKVSSVSKKINTACPWTVFYKFNIDENVSGTISAFYNATKKLMLQSGSTFARIVYTDSRFVKDSIEEL